MRGSWKRIDPLLRLVGSVRVRLCVCVRACMLVHLPVFDSLFRQYICLINGLVCVPVGWNLCQSSSVLKQTGFGCVSQNRVES